MIRTERLVLRPWRDDDLDAWAAMGRDSEVMEFFPALLTRERSDLAAARIRDHLTREGFGFWAVEVVGGPPFVGFCGLARPGFTAHFTPCVEVGWRLARASWGQGYASEAARAVIAFGLDTLALDEIVAFLVPANVRSASVCTRVGMNRDHQGDFDHPNVPVGTLSVGGGPLRRHALFRIARGQKASLAKVRPSNS